MNKIVAEGIGEFYDEAMFRLSSIQSKVGFLNSGYWRDIPGNSLEMAQINLIETMVQFFTATDGNVLDVACGTGASSRFLTKYFEPKNITGINVSARQLEACRMIAPDCKFLLMDATNLAFDAESFDNVLCIESSYHFVTRKKFFEEAYRVLRRDGRMAISDLLFGPAMSDLITSIPKDNCLPNAEAFRQSLLDVGFRYVRIEDTTSVAIEGLFRAITERLEKKIDNSARQLDYAAMLEYAALKPACCMAFAVK